MSRIGILGAGQLGRMLALAGYPLGLTFRFLDTTGEPPSAELGEFVHATSFEDEESLRSFAKDLSVFTFEFENVPAKSLEFLEKSASVYPGVRALKTSQDRLDEKEMFLKLGIEAPRFAAINTEADLQKAVSEMGLPAVLKTRRMGYDGKGQFRLKQLSDVPLAWKALGGTPLLLESFVPFDRELSVIAVRSTTGEVAWYPLVQNEHRDGILRTSVAPAPGTSDVIEQTARGYVTKILRELDYVGVLALELFDVGGKLLANEIAPRVHNSGHWTIEGAETSQFENHLRAILGLPLGSTNACGVSCMVNLIGKLPAVEAVLQLTGVHIHLYGKSEAENRKLGHITINAGTTLQLEKIKDALSKIL